MNGVDISSNHIWHSHVAELAVVAGKKLGFLFKAHKYLLLTNLATL